MNNYTNDVIGFIEQFKKDHPEEIIDLFMNGFCYYFAIILQERFFKNGIIMYIPIYNHFCLRYCGKFYDITGEIVDSEQINLAIPWSRYIDEEPIASKRIIADCILKLSEEAKAKFFYEAL